MSTDSELDPKHPANCPWYQDWHACNCGFLEAESDIAYLRNLAARLDSPQDKAWLAGIANRIANNFR